MSGFYVSTSKTPPLTDLNYESFISAGKEFSCGFDSKPSKIIKAKTIYCRRCAASFKIKKEKNGKIIIKIKSHQPGCYHKKEPPFDRFKL
jgi:hypothetical protein